MHKPVLEAIRSNDGKYIVNAPNKRTVFADSSYWEFGHDGYYWHYKNGKFITKISITYDNKCKVHEYKATALFDGRARIFEEIEEAISFVEGI